ncbi:MAG: imidazolonepropionase [Candidatus Aminicenantes bacterium]|nr:MAG: imidazolonepropionase [Candidatus Aminicenantes bacterium]
MNRADLAVLNCSQLLTCKGPIPKRESALQDVGLLENGCIASSKGEIVFVGDEEAFHRDVKMSDGGVCIDGQGLTGLPGFVDPHTHLPFAGSREDEFNLRVKGYTYQQLAKQGLGIQTTVNATRQASDEELLSLCLSRLDSMLIHGTTTVEAKSGYGLNKRDELKQLRVLKKADAVHPVDIVSTFMGAHEVPKEYKDRKAEYMDLLTQEILPEVKNQNLAEFFDVFCEEGVYSVEETRELIHVAKKAGFKIKIHADEFTPLGGAQLAAEEGAISAEHLIAITDDGIEKMAQSRTAAILLPGVSFFLMQQKTAPARKMIERGVILALATDFNPGSSMTESMLFILQLAVFTLKLGIEEAINTSTANASYALGKQAQVGSLEIGKKMDLILWDVPTYPYLVYHLGVNPIKHVIKNGKLAVEDGRILKTSVMPP